MKSWQTMRPSGVVLAVVVAIVAAVLSYSTSVYARDPQGRMPTVEAADLNGRSVRLPADFPAERTLALIAFQRDQQKDIDTWIDGMGLKTSDLPWLELPVINNPGAIGRWFIDNGMRNGIKGESARARVITIYTTKAAFNDALAITSEETVYAMVLDRSGAVLERVAGNYDPKAADRLRAALKTAPDAQ